MQEPVRTQLHPDVKELFDEAERRGTPTSHHMSPSGARVLVDRAVENSGLLSEPEPVGGEVVDHTIAGPNGDLPIRIYTPNEKGSHPVLVWYHGGGWVRGDLDSADGVCRYLCNAVGCSVVSVDYRLAPEHPFPAGVEDCYAATEWVADYPHLALGDADRIAVGGSSAGGNIAAAIALLARDRGGPDIAYQLLGVPVTDFDLDTESYHENAEGYGLYRKDMRYYWDHYLENSVDHANPYASPLRARSLADLPPAAVVTAGFDPLRDDGLQYYERLRRAENDATLLHYPDMPHNVMSAVYLNEKIGRAPKAFGDIAAELKDALEP